MVVIGVFVVYVGLAVSVPDFSGFIAIDPVLALLCAYALVSMTHRGSAATSGAVRLFPWVWCILLGSFLGLAGVGMAGWALANLLRTVFAFLAFICLWHLLIGDRLRRAAILGTALAFGVTCVLLVALTIGNVRGQALFPHANYAGHFCVLAAMILVNATRRWSLRIVILLGLAIALKQTSSFGAMAMFVSMVTVYGIRALARNTAILAVALAALVIGGLFLATPKASDLAPDNGSWSFTETISEERFDRSQTGRLEQWGQAFDVFEASPFGVGPDGARQRQLFKLKGFFLEIHSDPLGYLVERGLIGFVGFVGLWATLFAIARKRGLARVLIVGIVVSGVFRETMHYRHMWALLALGFAIDHVHSKRSHDVLVAGGDDDDPGVVGPSETDELATDGDVRATVRW